MPDASWHKQGRDLEALRREVVALQLLGPPIVGLLSWQDELVLERVAPGTPVAVLADEDDADAVAIAEALTAL